MKDQNSQRHWHRFSLRTMLIVMLLCTLLLAALKLLWQRVGPIGTAVILGSALVIVGPPVVFLAVWLAFWTVLLRFMEWLGRRK
jgi:hypothetical protein